MSNPHAVWDLYLSVQTKLKNSPTADDASWGREAQLNRLLVSGTLPAVDEVERVARSARRLERYRASLRRKHTLDEDGFADGEAAALAGHHLRVVEPAAGEVWPVLLALGEGWSYGELATATGLAAGTLRVRVQRARQRLLALAA